MRYLLTMVRISDVDASLHFYCDLLGLELVKTIESEKRALHELLSVHALR